MMEWLGRLQMPRSPILPGLVERQPNKTGASRCQILDNRKSFDQQNPGSLRLALVYISVSLG